MFEMNATKTLRITSWRQVAQGQNPVFCYSRPTYRNRWVRLPDRVIDPVTIQVVSSPPTDGYDRVRMRQDTIPAAGRLPLAFTMRVSLEHRAT